MSRAAAAGAACLMVLAFESRAQTPAALVSLGDAARARRDIPAALAHYEAAARLDDAGYAALWNASDAAVILGEFDPSIRRRDSLFAVGERYARRAVAANPSGADGHFALAQALGRMALTVPLLDRAKYALEIREHALAALAADPNHAGAYHVMGIWHQNVMHLGTLRRAAIALFLRTKIDASWSEAQASLERAVALEPARIVHRLDLGLFYLDRKKKADARAQLDRVLAAPAVEHNDVHYKRLAREALASIDRF